MAYSLPPNSAGNSSAVCIYKPVSYISQPAFTENLTLTPLTAVEEIFSGFSDFGSCTDYIWLPPFLVKEGWMW